jgi:hypothetical protein
LGALFYYIGGYVLPFLFSGICLITISYFIFKMEIKETEEVDKEAHFMQMLLIPVNAYFI